MTRDSFEFLPELSTLAVGSAEERFGGNSLRKVIENYVRYYASGDGHTAKAKRKDLEYFLIFLAGSTELLDGLRVADWTMQRTNDFVDSRISLGESPATVSRRLATIKHLGRTLAERLPGYINPAREVKSPNPVLTKPKGLSPEEISLLRDAAVEEVRRKDGSYSAIRNRFLLELLLATGLRADEVRLLVLGQLSDDANWLKNVRTKGKRFRNVYLDSNIREQLFSFMEHRSNYLLSEFPSASSLSSNPRIPLLASAYRASVEKPESFAMSPKGIWNAISAFGVLASGLSKSSKIHIHPHRLRHTFAHGLLDTSNDIRLVAQALGHSDVRITMRYTERSDEEVAIAIEKKRTADTHYDK